MSDFSINVFNPKFPKDRSKGVALTKEQFAVVHDYIIGQINDRKKIKEPVILDMLAKANLPVNFSE